MVVKLDPLYQVGKTLTILNSITAIKKELENINKAMEGINSFTMKELRQYQPWNDVEDFSDNFIEFKEKK